jgi:SNF2 family DNA or RNA helicase
MSSRLKDIIRRGNLEVKSYQEEGVSWCVKNEEGENPCGIKGGFIADEMGLGKTIQMVGVMYCNFVKNTLIIMPTVLLDQWYIQICRLTGHKAVIYHGENKKKITAEVLSSAKIVLTSYDNISGKKGDLHRIKWSRIIFDEAHHLRNKNTMVYRGAKSLKSKIRWLVSGTPVQNSKKDFYALCSLIGLPASYYMDGSNLRELTRSFVLKRTKKQLGIKMEELHISKSIVEWSSTKEKELSEYLHSSLAFSGVRMKSGTNITLLSALGGKGPLPLILRARQSCIYPKLMVRRLDDLVNKGMIGDYTEYREGLTKSSKLDAAINVVLERKDNGCGKLIFCHFREEIDEIERRLREGGISKVVKLDGRTHAKNRHEILTEANDVLILQIQTGCEGLNLQEHYSEIYFISPHWNPAVEDQAIARCHRIGQKKEVNVYRFEMDTFGQVEDASVSTRTIDKYVDDVQEIKRIVSSEAIPA